MMVVTMIGSNHKDFFFVIKLLFVIGSVILLALPLLSDAQIWPMFRVDSKHSGRQNNFLCASLLPSPVTKWTYLTSGRVASSPAIGSDGTIYVGSYDFSVYALNGSTGALKWKFSSGGIVYASPAIGSDGTIYFGADYRVYALNGSTGSVVWTYTTGSFAAASPTFGSDGTVFIGSYDRNMYALDGSTGAYKWSYPTGYFIRSCLLLEVMVLSILEVMTPTYMQ